MANLEIELEEAEQLAIIPANSRYWLIRTDGGSLFEEFVNHGYIAIGWNEISLSDLRRRTEEEIKHRITEIEGLNPDDARDKSKATAIFNKLSRFANLQNGDFVVVPSEGSAFLGFGQIVDDRIYSDSENVGVCEYHKRRRIEWFTVKELSKLDSKFYEIKSNRHSISSLDEYQDFIDRVISKFFFKGEYATVVFDVNQEENIHVEPLLELVNDIQTLIDDINQEFNLDEDPSENVIKVNLQSRGSVSFRMHKGYTLAILCLAITLNSCGTVDEEKLRQYNIRREHLDHFKKRESAKLDSINRNAERLQIQMESITENLTGER